MAVRTWEGATAPEWHAAPADAAIVFSGGTEGVRDTLQATSGSGTRFGTLENSTIATLGTVASNPQSIPSLSTMAHDSKKGDPRRGLKGAAGWMGTPFSPPLCPR